MERETPAKIPAQKGWTCGRCGRKISRGSPAGEMEPGVFGHWQCVQDWWRDPTGYRKAVKQAAELDRTNKPGSSSVRATSAGLPTLGRRR